MFVLEAQQIEKSYRDRLIVKLDELKVHDQDRIGIVGINGAGKTTLLNLLAGAAHVEKGKVKHHGKAAIITQQEDDGVGRACPEYESKWHVAEADSSNMSGGEKTRRKIALALEDEAAMLFADEPTSHLDLEGIEMLEDALHHYSGAVLLISHDRQLLDAVCTKILEVENGEIHAFSGNYSDYLEQKEHQKARAWFEYEQYSKEKRRLEGAAVEKANKVKTMRKAPKRMGISEARLHKRSANEKKEKLDKNVKAIESRIEHLEMKEKPKEQERVRFDIQTFAPIHSKAAVRCERVTKMYGERTLFRELSFSVKPGMKVAVAGKNGAGKSTLLKMIAAGEEGIWVSGSGKIGFFHQDLVTLDNEKTIYENVSEGSPYSEQLIRTMLARLLFKRDDVFKPVGVLSGGEKVKISLVKVFLGDYNILLLDEPTNYLDLFTHEELQAVLEAYPGTILFATHDRRLMNRIADHVLVFEGEGKAAFFEGNYEQYLKSKENPKPSGTSYQLELMKCENELAEVIGRLSYAEKAEEKQSLEIRYEDLLNQIRKLKETT